MSEKVKTQHVERKTILDVRQSSAYQVAHTVGCQKLQYAMQDRLRQQGWCEIEVVDEDLGRSAAGTLTCAGFERMVSEVCLGKVGAVAAREVSRSMPGRPCSRSISTLGKRLTCPSLQTSGIVRVRGSRPRRPASSSTLAMPTIPSTTHTWLLGISARTTTGGRAPKKTRCGLGGMRAGSPGVCH